MLRPIGNKVVCVPIDMAARAQDSQGLIVLPEWIARDLEYRLGTVVGLGRGEKVVPERVVLGDVVLWKKFTGESTSVDGEELIVLDIDHVLGVVDE